MEYISLKDFLIRIFFILLCCFMMNRLFFFSPGIAESTTAYILYPLIKIQKVCTDYMAARIAKKSHIAELENNVATLKLCNEDLQAKIIALESTLDFKKCSQEIRDFEQKYDFSQKKIAQVLMRSFDDAGHFYWVDAGSCAGIRPNMIAIYKNNIVGRVIDVNPVYSKIALVTDKRCKIAAMCLRSKVVGIYQGKNDFVASLEFVPHYENLIMHDLVMSTGQGLMYPQGFALGKVVHFEVEDVEYNIAVESLVDLRTIEYVYLIAM